MQSKYLAIHICHGSHEEGNVVLTVNEQDRGRFCVLRIFCASFKVIYAFSLRNYNFSNKDREPSETAEKVRICYKTYAYLSSHKTSSDVL